LILPPHIVWTAEIPQQGRRGIYERDHSTLGVDVEPVQVTTHVSVSSIYQ